MHPDRGARSIGIGHPRSGDRCTEPQPTLSTPCGSSSRHLQCRRPAKGRGMMCTLIHRSSALRASTDAYGACILRMRESHLCSGLHMRPCPMTLRRSAGRALRQACSPFAPGRLWVNPKTSALFVPLQKEVYIGLIFYICSMQG